MVKRQRIKNEFTQFIHDALAEAIKKKGPLTPKEAHETIFPKIHKSFPEHKKETVRARIYDAIKYGDRLERSNGCIALKEYVSTPPVDPTHREQGLKGLFKHVKKELLKQYESGKKCLYVDYETVFDFNKEIAELLVKEPQHFGELVQLFQEDVDDSEDEDLRIGFDSLTTTRIYHMKKLGVDLIDELIGFHGVIQRQSERAPHIAKAIYICPKCGDYILREQEIGPGMREPHYCPSCKKSITNAFLDKNQSTWTDIQQLIMDDVTDISNSRGLKVYVDHPELVDIANIGDEVEIIGAYRTLPPKYKTPTYESYVLANSIKPLNKGLDYNLTDEDIDQIKEYARSTKHPLQTLANSLEPSIHGLDDLKKALILYLVKGTEGKKRPSGLRLRNDIHILAIGNPSTGKTVLGDAVIECSPKGLRVNAKGLTEAGLTGATLFEKGMTGPKVPVIAPGAMTRASGGHLHVSELDKFKDDQREALHDPLEDGYCQIDKGGARNRLEARTGVYATANPIKGRWDKFKPIADQVNISNSLITRFDLVFAIGYAEQGEKEANTHDKAVANMMTKTHLGGTAIEADWGSGLMRNYLAYTSRLKPSLTKKALRKLEDYYLSIKLATDSLNTDYGGYITPRAYTSLIRLAEASAKIHQNNTVTKADAAVAIDLYNAMLRPFKSDDGRIDPKKVFGTDLNPQKLLDTFKELKKESSGGEVSVKDLKAAMDVPPDKFKALLHEAKQKGYLFEPKAGMLGEVER